MAGDYRASRGYSADPEEPAYRTETPYDIVSDQIPLWNSLSGASGRMQAHQDQRTADANRTYWDELNAGGPEDFTADYQYDEGQGQDAQTAALAQLGQWARGGLTGADRAMMDSQRGRSEQASGSQRQALMQQSQARGMGGSGLDAATQMMASQQGQTQASDIEAQMMMGAQQRQLAATQAAGSLATGQRGQMQHETERREDARIGGNQQAFDNAATRAAGATGQYSTDSAARQSARDRQQEGNDDVLGAIAGLFA